MGVYIGLPWHQFLSTKSITPYPFNILCDLTESDALTVAVTENWHLSPPVREECMSSSCLTRMLPAGCVCCLWLYLSPYVLAGCTVRQFNGRSPWYVYFSFLTFVTSGNSILSFVNHTAVTQFHTEPMHIHCIMILSPLLQSYFFSALCWRTATHASFTYMWDYTKHTDLFTDILWLYDIVWGCHLNSVHFLKKFNTLSGRGHQSPNSKEKQFMSFMSGFNSIIIITIILITYNTIVCLI